jgi:hypothetical protein
MKRCWYCREVITFNGICWVSRTGMMCRSPQSPDNRHREG